jgi:(R,R)-butanediol dehydrogenase/meso-butanediol dehydrogenase/diacetyl reductase
MKAIVFDAVNEPLRLAELPAPRPGPGELLIKVDACGICASDLHAVETEGMLEPGVVMGHEYSGTVTELGETVSDWAVGDRLIAVAGKACGSCPACARGQPMECEDFLMQGFDPRMTGAYAEYTLCSAALAFHIPDSLNARAAAAIEPMAVGLSAWKTAQVADGAHVLVIGAGIIGLAVAKWARFFGAGGVALSERVPARLERALSVGVDEVIDASEYADPVAEYRRRTGHTPSIIFECVGRPLLAQMIEMAAPNSQLVMVGTGMQPEQFVVLPAALKRLRVTFCMAYEPSDFPFVLAMLAAGRVTVEELITATVDLDATVETFTMLGQPNDHCKVLITP